MEKRGLTPANGLDRFRLGYVDDPLPGHEMFKGFLSIPYLRRSADHSWFVIAMRFRCIKDGCEHSNHGKYMSSPGDPPRLYNTKALQDTDDKVAICEGEIDTLTAELLIGIPAVGVAGVESWKPHFREPFVGYQTVFVLSDGDEPGMKFAHSLAKQLPNVTILPSGHGDDVNSEVLKYGPERMRDKIK